MEDMKSVELAIMTPAREAEGMMDEVFTQAAPRGNFSKVVMNRLVSAYRKAQELMGFPEDQMYPEFEADVTEFPAEFVRGLAMMAAAAEDYGQPGLIELADISEDADVARLAATIESLVSDPDFADFLQSPLEGEEVGEEAEVAEGEEDMEEMFASRA
jgi:hypothetical protein